VHTFKDRGNDEKREMIGGPKMANSITVNTATVKSKAGELKTLNASFKKLVDELKTTESSLNTMWEGDAKTEFHNAFNNDTVQMTNFYNAIEKYVQNLETIVAKYESAEQKNVTTASQRSY
jgi:WXG100 family type VII secretion target